ncbi:dephospho-CoA kinase [Frigoribacterium faeni]|uniref:Dephospho-CoA kinase n=1 Tax=Frigoribacterium faeni TaxID=145483 RepID=A0A7W3JHI5_9MICO|nr:dephospho-CoA kinase [Frigoribacterium faeni]MBA8812884.1 dephospho-CoA kinase [Frigoribacterium faeni]GEK81924.1 dephospho-CoA kinase [Frigoribacterium faeni]
MFVCGLTGGIAAGKSTVSTRLAERGAAVVDADRLAREVVEPGTPGLSAVVARFGVGVLTSDGVLDRAALGAIVFADASARADLEGIIHPAVRELSAARMTEAVRDDPARVVVYDVPLLVESRGAGEFDVVAVVHAPREERLRRLIRFRGMAEDEAGRRIDAQADDATRLAAADLVVDASGTLDETRAHADELYERLRSLSAAKADVRLGPGVSGRS